MEDQEKVRDDECASRRIGDLDAALRKEREQDKPALEPDTMHSREGDKFIEATVCANTASGAPNFFTDIMSNDERAAKWIDNLEAALHKAHYEQIANTAVVATGAEPRHGLAV